MFSESCPSVLGALVLGGKGSLGQDQEGLS